MDRSGWSHDPQLLGGVKSMFPVLHGLEPTVISLAVLGRLRKENCIEPQIAVAIELARLKAGIPLTAVEEKIALALSDEFDDVDLTLAAHGHDRLTDLDRRVMLYIGMADIRSRWADLETPQFELEEMLVLYDAEHRFDEMRFFRPVPRIERNMAAYVARVDARLREERDSLNSAAVD